MAIATGSAPVGHNQYEAMRVKREWYLLCSGDVVDMVAKGDKEVEEEL